jgi:cytoskeletal protein CcmA (bactofilin family)
MATAIQRRRGSTAQHANFTGLSGEITVDTDLNTIIVHDGSTAGGERLARFSELTEFSGNAVTSITTDSNSGLLGGVTEGSANLSINYESLTGNLVPSANNTFSLGSPTNVWKDLYVGAETIFIDGVSLSVVGGGLQFGGNAVAVADDPSVTTDGITEGNINLYYTDGRVDAHLSGGTGVTYASGTISIGQGVATDDDVSFNDVTVSGNLTVSGTTTTVNTEELKVADNIITLNSDYTGGAPSADAGMEVERGDLDNVSVFWDESQDKWRFTNDGSTNFDLATSTTDLAEGTNLYYTDSRARDAVSASGDLSYNNSTGVFSFTERTDSEVRGLVSVNDAGGDGSLSYNSGSGVFTYTGPSAAEARAHFSGGLGVTITDGEVAIGQAVSTGDNVTFNNITADGVFAGNGSALSSLDAGNISTGTLASARLPELVVGDFADAAIQTGAETFADSDTVLMTAAAVNDRIEDLTDEFDASVITTGTLSNDRTTATSANTGNTIVERDGSGNFSAGTITATATQAQYADVAERYEADTVIEPGTVVCFGGDKEITVCAHSAHHAVAGVISTDPAYLMNQSAGNDDTHPPVALTGRVPCKVTGPVAKGDLMVTSSVAGHARADNDAAPGRILGKAIDSSEGGEAVIEVLVTLM